MKTETRIWLVIFVLAAACLAWDVGDRGASRAYVREVDGRVAPATVADYVAGTAQFSLSRTIGIWVAALLTLGIFSFLYRDNPFYKLTESILVGVSAAYWMVVAYWDVLIPNLFGKIWPGWIQSWAMPGLSPQRDEYWFVYLVPLALGIMLLWRLSPRGSWIGLWPLAFSIGATAGLRLVAYFQADFLGQIRSGIMPLAFFKDSTLDVERSIENIVLVTGTICCLAYFFFSFEHKGTIGRASQIGVWVLMITFGAGFGYTVMGRIALLAIRLEFLFDDWLWLIDPSQRRLGM
ncbi:MAG TPA: hypothetical protein VEI07_21635 [Planctomycetaceae bacterium]|nr:hypothetical protein [Planctomycetaceae bacterium]